MAEEVGFEPTKGVNPCQFSRLVLSTAQPPFLISLFKKARILRDFFKYSITSTVFLQNISSRKRFTLFSHFTCLLTR